jgi:hypothetical protein
VKFKENEMRKGSLIAACALSLAIVSGSAFAQDADAGQERLQGLDRGDRVEQRLDRRGDVADRRLDRASRRADAADHDRAQRRFDRAGDRVDRRFDRRGVRIDRRFDRRQGRR